MTTKQQILSGFNLNSFEDSIKVGGYITIPNGEFICKSKPNLYQPIDSRFWEFEQTSDADGEPVTDGEIVKIKL